MSTAFPPSADAAGSRPALTPGASLRLVFRLAWRLLRGSTAGRRLPGLGGAWLVMLCLALGVSSIAAIGLLRAGIASGITADGTRLLGGDVEIRINGLPISSADKAWITAQGATLSETAQMRAMLVAPDGDPLMVELKAVDTLYPLYGHLGTAPERAAGDPLHELVVEETVTKRLQLHLGDTVRIGTLQLPIGAILTSEPDQASSPALFGPRVLIPLDQLAATGLIQPGSLINWHYRLRLGSEVDSHAFVDSLRAHFHQGGWRIRTADDAVPGMRRFLDRATTFLILAGLTTLLTGGMGVAMGVRVWLERQAKSLAVLRSLGATPGVVFWACLLQVLALGTPGIILGLLLGQVLALGGGLALMGALPVVPAPGLYLAPLGLAALYGVLVMLLFALPPLGRTLQMPGAALFREAATGSPVGLLINPPPPRVLPLVAATLAGLALVALTICTAQDLRLAGYFCVAAVVLLLLLRLAARGLMAGLRRLRPRNATLRLALANLHRPGAATAMVLPALGLGLATLTAITALQGTLQRELHAELPARAPGFFLLDIQPDQVAPLDAMLRTIPGAETMRRLPSLRARIAAVDGIPVERLSVSPDSAWALRGDRGLTYSANPPPGTRLVAGSWWPSDYHGPPLLSLDARLARGWGVEPGDSVTLEILGRSMDFRIASLREVNWQALNLNFALIASPGVLEAAPHTQIATLAVPQAEETTLLRQLAADFPNMTAIRVREALTAIANLLGKLGSALAAVGMVTLAAGLLVLGGAVAAGQRRRARDAVVLKALGATRWQLTQVWLIEFSVLGLAAGVIAVLAGNIAAYGVSYGLMGLPWTFLPGPVLGTILAGLALALCFGQVGTILALRARTAPQLRNE